MSLMYLKGSAQLRAIYPPDSPCTAHPSAILRSASELSHRQLQKILVVRRTALRGDVQPGADHVGNPLAVESSHLRGDFQPALQKGFNQFGFLQGESGCLVQGELGFSGRIEKNPGLTV